MPKYAIYNPADGSIHRTVDVPAEYIEMQLAEGEHYVECDAQPHDSIDLNTQQVIQGKPLPTMAELLSTGKKRKQEAYKELRAKLYPTVGDQLDQLFHAVDEGLFGEAAKESQWFKRVNMVKQSVPKGELTDPALVYFMETIPETEYVDPSMQASTSPVFNKDAFAYLSRLAYTRRRKDKKKNDSDQG